MFKTNQFPDIFKLFWPIAMAMFLTSALSLIDSAMISGYNVVAISSISIATQPQFFFGPMYYGILTGVNIYSVQYFARGDYSKLKQFAGIGLIMLITLGVINFLTLLLFSSQIVSSYVPEGSDVYLMSLDYIKYFKFSVCLLPFDMFFMYQYRAIKRPKIAMYMNTSQAVLNIIFNYFLIYGHGPFNEMGVSGAALGTLLARIITLIINLIVAYKLSVPFVGKFSEMFSFEFKLFKELFLNTLPLIFIELGFGVGNIIFTKIYATTDIDSFTAFNIAKTISFTVNAFVIATANVSGILVGGAISNEYSKEKLDEVMHNIFSFITLCSVLLILLAVFILPMFIPLFGDSQEMSEVIQSLLLINGIWMAIRVFSSSFIAILKSGNDNRFVMFIEYGGTYLVAIPIALMLMYFTSPGIIILRATIIFDVLFKVMLGFYRYKQGKWIVKL